MRWASLLVICLALVSCSKRETTGELGRELADEMRALPEIVRTVEDLASAEIAVTKLNALTEKVIQIAERSDVNEPLTLEQSQRVEKVLREAQEETEYLLTQLSAKPELVVKLTDSIAKLGDALEFASKVMKGAESE